MDVRQLAELRLQTGYAFENGTPFYEKLGEKRAEARLKALLAHGYRIVSRAGISRPSGNLAHAERRGGAENFILNGSQAEAERGRGRLSNGWLAWARRARREDARGWWGQADG